MSTTTAARIRPASLILAASVISGAAGYLTTAIVAGQLGARDYAAFAVFWSSLYFVVGTFGGLQQEVTRATSGAVMAQRPASLRIFAAVVAGLLVLVMLVSGLFWGPLVFPAQLSPPFIVALAVGSAGYVGVAVLGGSLFGIRQWTTLAALITVDGLLRLILVLLALWLRPEPVVTAWAVVAPFPIAVLIVLPVVFRRLRRELTIDVAYGQLSWNVARTLAAAAATAALISGLPLLLRISSPEIPAAELGPIMLVLTLARAPIVIPLLSLQSYLIVRFGDAPKAVAATVVRLGATVIGAAVVLAIPAGLLGPWLLTTLVGPEYIVDPLLIGIVVSTAGLVATLCITGPAVLAAGQHGAFVAGWAVSALMTAGLLVLPLPVDIKLFVALTLGPLTGLVIHGAALRSMRRRLSTGQTNGHTQADPL